jgi:hypothetical protein
VKLQLSRICVYRSMDSVLNRSNVASTISITLILELFTCTKMFHAELVGTFMNYLPTEFEMGSHIVSLVIITKSPVRAFLITP